MSASERLDEIQARYSEWHQDRGDHTPAPDTDTWTDADHPDESMDHCIVRNDVPPMASALRAVLDLHKPMRIYEHEDSCEDESEEHREERHVESIESIGEYYCLDLPTGITLCAECSRDLDFDGRDYPCPTVRAVTEALGEGS